MPIIRVKNAQVHERQVNGKNGPMLIRRQMAEVDRGDGYALPFSLGLGQRPPYPPGDYDIDPQSFELSDYGDLRLGRYVDLVPLAHKAAKPAA